MKSIAQLTLPEDLNIELLFDHGKLAYTFSHQDKTFGNAVKLPSKSVLDIASSCLILFTNAVETKKALENESHT